jgi:hypothetical protein
MIKPLLGMLCMYVIHDVVAERTDSRDRERPAITSRAAPCVSFCADSEKAATEFWLSRGSGAEGGTVDGIFYAPVELHRATTLVMQPVPASLPDL